MADRIDNRGAALRSTRDERTTIRPGEPDAFTHGGEVATRIAPKILGSDRERSGLRIPAPPESSLLESTPEVRHMLDMPESVFLARLDERVRRANVLLDLLRAGTFSRDAGARALRSQLDAVTRGAAELGMPELVSLLGSLSDAVMTLADDARVPRRADRRDVLVIDEDDAARDIVALTVESQGHTARCARDFDEFVALFDECPPDVVLSDVELEKAPARFYCTTLRDVVGKRPIVFYARRTDDDVREATDAARGDAFVSKAEGVRALAKALAPFLRARAKALTA